MTADRKTSANSEVNKNPRGQGKRKRKRLDPATSRVVVIGAGLAGLSTALSLRRAGFRNVDIYERDPSLEYQKEGYGLTLTYNPKGPLAELGVLETVARKDCPSRSHYLFRQEPSPQCKDDSKVNDTAVPMGYFGNAFFPQESRWKGYGQRGNLRIPRKVLRKILHDELVELKERESEEGFDSTTSDLMEDISPSSLAVHWNHLLVDFQWDVSMQQYRLKFAKPSSSSKAQGETCRSIHASNEISTTTADLLVAADGIRSCVLQKLYNNKRISDHTTFHSNSVSIPSIPTVTLPSIRENPEQYGLQPMGIRLILGIADGIDHPLLRERGFYTVDTHGHRLFTMPYQSNRFDTNSKETVGNHAPKKKNRIMWQLSFSTPRNAETLDSASLRKYVLETFQSWHPPVLDLVRSTPPTSIWGTDLMDRNPRKVYEELIVGKNKGELLQPRLVVCGDALHPMSPFKGQGANQALADGPPLAKWLSKSSIDAALTNWWRETLNRTAPVVEASRKAAKDWHNPERILGTSEKDHQEYHGFAGVGSSFIPRLIEILRSRRIGPHLGGDLDRTVRDVIEEYGWFDEKNPKPETDNNGNDATHIDDQVCKRVLRLAASGDTAGLRQMTLPSSGTNVRSCAAMVNARDGDGRSCLHLAAMGTHRFTCQWLLVELRILEQWECRAKHDVKDNADKTAFDYALETGDKSLIRIFEAVLKA